MSDHLTAQQMLAYLDGELSRAQRQDAKEHLHACWTCRTEIEHLKTGIGAILDAQQKEFVPALPAPPRRWASLDALLPDSGLPQPDSRWRRLRTHLEHLFSPVRALAFSAVIAILTVGVYSMLKTEPVSAKEVLRKMRAADAQRNIITPDQVIRQRIRILKRSHGQASTKTVSLDAWKSTHASHWQVIDKDSAAAELEAEYQSHGIPEELPLSAAAVDSWGQIAGGAPAASKDGSEMNLTFISLGNNGKDAVQRVSLLVQPQTWQIHEMTLDFPDVSFEIHEDDFSVMPSSAIPTTLLAYLEPNSVPNLPVSAHTLSAVSAPIHLPSVNLEKAELDVLSTLHRLKADLGEPVTVTRSSETLHVALWQLPEDRRDELQAALAEQPGVVLDLSKPKAHPIQTPPAPATTLRMTNEVSLEISADPAEDDQQLLKFFGTPEKKRSFSDDVLAVSTEMLAHLYALRNLQERFSVQREHLLTSEEQTQLHSLIEDHVTAVTADIDVLEKQLAPLDAGFHIAAPVSPEPEQSSDWQSQAQPTLETARSVDHLLRALLTSSQTPLSASEALPAIAQRLTALHAELSPRTAVQR